MAQSFKYDSQKIIVNQKGSTNCTAFFILDVVLFLMLDRA